MLKTALLIGSWKICSAFIDQCFLYSFANVKNLFFGHDGGKGKRQSTITEVFCYWKISGLITELFREVGL